MRSRNLQLLMHTTMLCGAAAVPSAVFANPEGGNVVGGSATISQNDTTLTVNQHSDRAIIDWSTFDIAQNELTQFLQPSNNSIALNRIRDTKPSNIQGRLQANGMVILVNPNGVMFGANSQVNVNSLVVSSADVANDDFMTGQKIKFDKPGAPNAQIIARGQITVADAGLVGLVAPQVENHGVISAKLGKVQMASADSFSLDLAGDGITEIAVSGDVAQQIVHNSGTIDADGGTVTLSAAAARSAVDALVTNTGRIKANSISQKNGVIRLSAARGKVRNTGTIEAKGGEVRIAAPKVEQQGIIDVSALKAGLVDITFGESYIDTSASAIFANSTQGDGGTITLTGGENSTLNASGTYEANSLSGNGGVITLSAANVVQDGTFSARGVNAGGNITVNFSMRYDAATSAVLDVSSQQGSGGIITVEGGDDASLYTSGSYIADGQTTGGAIDLLVGRDILLLGAQLSATGNFGGGYVRVGGDYQGGGNTRRAKRTLLDNDATINVSAIDNGNGGTAIIWSDEQTIYYGDIIARGGENGGDGGFVEVSSKHYFEFEGDVDVKAPQGANGTLLLDPADLYIYTPANTNVTGSPDFTTTAGPAYIQASVINNLLQNGTNVTVTTTTGTGSGDIYIYTAISTTGSGSLTLNASRNITSLSGVGIAMGTGDLIMRARRSDGATGYISMLGAITSNGGDIIMGGGSGTISAGSGFAIGDNSAGGKNGIYINGYNINAGGGDIIMNGQGGTYAAGTNYGVHLYSLTNNNVVTTSGSGNIAITGVGGSVSNNNYGIYNQYTTGYNFLVTNTGSGSVTLNGTAGSGSSNYGLYYGGRVGYNGSNAFTGGINIAATGLGIYGDSLTMQTSSGNINLTGTTNIVGSPVISTASGSVTFSGSGSTATAIGAITATGGNVTLTSGGNLTTGAISAGADVTISSGGDFTSGAITTTNSSGNDIAITSVGYTSVGGAITGGSLSVRTRSANASTGYFRVTGDVTTTGGITIGGGSTAVSWGSGFAVGNSSNGTQYGIYFGGNVTSTSGNILLQGVGGTYASGSNYGVNFAKNTSNTTLSAGGNVSIWAIGGSASNNNYALLLSASTYATNITAGSNLYIVTASGTGSNNFGVYAANANSFTATGGDIYISMDKLSLHASATVSAGASVYYVTNSAGNTMGVGTGSGTLSISGTLIGNTTYGNTLIFGSTGSGALDVNYSTSFAKKVQFISGDNITFSSAVNSSVASGDAIYVDTRGSFTASGAIAVSAAGAINILSTGNITTLGLSTTGGAISLKARQADAATGYVSVTGNISTSGGAVTIGGGSATVSAGTGFAIGGSTNGTQYGVNIAGNVQAAGGSILINAIGGTYTSGNNHGIYFSKNSSNTTLSTTGSGNIQLWGVGGSGGNDNYGLTLSSGSYATNITTVSGNIDLVGISNSGTGNYSLYSAVGNTISSTNGYVILHQDKISLAAATTVSAGTYVQYRIATPGTTIGIGSGSGTLNISSTLIGNTTYGTVLIFGDTPYSGAIDFNYSTAFTKRVQLLSASNITLSSAFNSSLSGADALYADARGNLTSSAITASSAGNINITASGYVSTGALSTAGGNIWLRARQADAASGYVSVNGNISTSGGAVMIGGGSATLSAGSGFAIGSSTNGTQYGINIAGNISAAGGNIVLNGQGGTYASGDNYGIYFSKNNANTTVSTTGSGSITVWGVGGSAGNNNYGTILSNGSYAASFSSVSGGITIVGSGGSGSNNYSLYSAVSNSFNASSSSVTFGLNKLSLASGTTVNAGTHALYWVYNPDTTIGVGSGSGTLNISSDLLNNTTVGTKIYIGDTTKTAAMEINHTSTIGSKIEFRTKSGSNITLSGNLTSSAAGDAIIIAAGGNFINSTSRTISLTNVGTKRWVIYSTAYASDTRGGITNSAVQFGYTYDTLNPTSISGTGTNTWVYSAAAAGTITITADNASRAYGDVNPSFTASYSCSTGCSTTGLVASGSLSLTTGATETSAVGGYTITAAQGTATFAESFFNTYNIGYTNGTLTVSKANLTVTADSLSKTYGSVSFAGTEFTSSGLKNNETIGSVTLGLSGGTGTSSSGNYNAGSWTLTPSAATGGSFTASNYNITYQAGTLTINTKALTIATGVSANNKVYDANTTATLTVSSPTFSGVVGADNVSLNSSSYTATFADANVANGISVGVSGLALSGTDAANYSLTQPSSLSANITQRTLTITADNKTIDYGASLTKTYNTSGLQGGQTIGSVTLTDNATISSSGHRNAGSWSITPSAATGGTFNAANYSINYVPGTLTIQKLAITVIADNQDKTYGDTFIFDGDEIEITGSLASGESLAAASLSSLGSAASAAVNTYSITASNATGTNFSASNYDITYQTGTMTVGKRNLTITADDQSKTYGQTFTFDGDEYDVTGLANNETIGSITLSSVGASSTAGVNTYTIVGSNATGGTFNAANYDINYVDGTMTVGKAALTITADDQTKIYGDVFTFTGTEFDAVGLQNSETIGSATIGSAGAGALAGVNTYDITIGSATGGTFDINNYEVTYETGTLTVGKRTLTITADDQAKTYGDDFTFIGDEYDVTGLQNSETIGGVTMGSAGAATSAAVGDYDITIGSATGGTFDANNYTIVYNNGTMAVGKATLTITADDQSKTYGQTFNFAGDEFQVTGLVNNETIGSATITSAGSSATASVNDYDINISNATGGTFDINNYNVTYTKGTLTVDKASLTITADDQTKIYGDNFTFDGDEFDAAGLQNNETIGSVTLSSSGSLATAGVNDYDINISAATGGTFDINNYDVTYVKGTLSVTRRDLIITADDQGKTYGTGFTFDGDEYDVTGLQNSETIGSVNIASGGAAASAAVGTYDITIGSATGGSFDANNYNITYNNGTMTVGKATLTITADDQSKTYGQTFTFDGDEYDVTGLANNETIGSVTINSSGSIATAGAGTYDVNISGATGGTFNAANYTIVYTKGMMTVDKANVTITADDQTKTYGQTFTFTGTEFDVTGLQNDETIGSATIASAGSAATAGVNSYSITIGSATGGTFDANNYNITYQTGTMTVGKATLTITADNQAKTYGQTFTFDGDEFDVVGLQNNETIGSATISSAGSVATASVNDYDINISAATGGTFDINNYDVTYTKGTMTVGKASLTITADDQTKTYGTTFTFDGDEFDVVGLQNADTIDSATITSSGAASSANVGDYDINISSAAGTFDANNYTITYTKGTLSVGKANLTITADDLSKTYSEVSFDGTEFTYTGLAAGDTIDSVSLAVSGATTSSSGNYNVGNWNLVASNATGSSFDANNYTITYVDGTLTIGAKALTLTSGVSANDKVYDANTSAVLAFNSPLLAGVAGLDEVAVSQSGYTATFADANVADDIGVTVTGLGLSGDDAANYTLTQPTGLDANITKRDLTVTADDQNITYGNDDDLIFTFSSVGLQAGQTIGSVSMSDNATTNSMDHRDAGTWTISASNATGGTFNANNYNITYNTGTLIVDRANLTITADDINKTYGSVSFNGDEFSHSALIDGDVIDSVTLNVVGATTSSSGNYNVGDWDLRASNATGSSFKASNYNITYVDGTVSVAAKNLTVASGVSANNKVYDANTTGSLSFNSPVLTGYINGDDTSLSQTGYTATFADANVANNIAVTVSGLTLMGDDAANYTITQPTGYTANITPRALTITAENKNIDYGDDASLNFTFSSVGLQDNQTIGSVTFEDDATTNAMGHRDAGTWTISASAATGGTFNAANYSITYNPGTLIVDRANLTITADDLSKTYGSVSFAGTEFTHSALIDGDVIDSVSLAVSGATTSGSGNYNVGTWDLVASGAAGTNFKASNYNITYVDGSVDIGAKTLTVASGVSANNKVYDANTGATLSFNSPVLTGYISGDDTALSQSGYTATFADANVADDIGVTVTGLGLSGNDAGNYVLAQPTGLDANITKRDLTITADDESITYGDDTSYTFTSSGLQANQTIGSVTFTDDATLSGAGERRAGDWIITASAATGGTFNANNYNITYETGDLHIAKKNLTITGITATKEYDGTTSATLQVNNVNIDTVLNGDDVSVSNAGATGSFLDANVGNNKLMNVSGISIDGDDADNYSISDPSVTGTITARNLTITADDQSKTYGDDFTFTGSEFTYSGLVSGETIGSVSLSSTGADATAGVDDYDIDISGATGGTFNAANYNITYETGTLTVGKATLNITAGDNSKTYGQNLNLGSSNFTATGLKNNETIGSVTLSSPGATSTAGVGTYAITGSAATGGTFDITNYDVTYTDGTLTVGKAALTITADDQSKIYGDDFTFLGDEYDVAGLQNSETIGSVSIASSGADAEAAAGDYDITIGSAAGGTFDAANYDITYVKGTMSVGKATLTITADDQTKTYGQAFTFNGDEFGATGLVNNETIGSVTLSSTGSAATASVNDYDINVSGATGGTFNAANYTIVYVKGTMSVDKATLTITASDQIKTYGQTFNFDGDEFDVTGLQNNETIGSATINSAGSVATAGVNDYDINISAATGGTFDINNYDVTYTKGTMSVGKAALTITAQDQTKTYGTTFTFDGDEFDVTGLQNNETIGSATIASAGSAATAGVADYNITIGSATGGTFNAANYNITYETGTLSVGKATLTITADDQSKTYGQAFTFDGDEYDVTGLANNETIGSVSFSSTGSAATAGAGDHDIIASNATGGTFDINNYNVIYNTGTLSVGKANLTLTAHDQNKTYGQAFTFDGDEYDVTGLQNSETIGSISISSTGAAATAAAGDHDIIIGSAAGGTFDINNYNVTYNSGTFSVDKANVTVTAKDQSKTYGDSFTFDGDEFDVTGLQNSETIGSVTLTSAGAAASANVDDYDITASNATGGTFDINNYNITYDTGTLTVGKAILNITADDQSKTYGQTFTFNGDEYGVTGLKNNETIGAVTISSSGSAAIANAGDHTITISDATGGTFDINNYDVTYTSGTMSVGRAALTITADDQNKTYGQTFTFDGDEYDVVGLQNNETIGGVTLGSAGAAASASVDDYDITIGSATGGTFNASNYDITYVNGTMVVGKATLTITADDQNKTYGDAFTFDGDEFGAVGLANNETIGSITLTSTGSAATAGVADYDIFALNATGGSFDAANYDIIYVKGTMSIGKATLTVSAKDQAKTYGQAFTFDGDEFDVTGLKNNETIGSASLSSTGSAATANAGDHDIVISNATGGTFDINNYDVTYETGNMSVGRASLTITADDQSKTYGDNFVFDGDEYDVVGLQNNETIGSVNLASSGAASSANAGGYDINISAATGGTFSAGNYNITYVKGTFTVNKKGLTVTANDETRVYGGANPNFSATITGFVNGDTESVVSGEADLSTDATTHSSVGTYYIRPGVGTLSAGNYTFDNFVDGTLTITKADLTITADDLNRTFGDVTFDGDEYSYTGLVSGDEIDSVTLSVNGSHGTSWGEYNAGLWSLDISNASGVNFDINNYNVTYVSGALTIDPKAITISANDNAREYGASNPSFSYSCTTLVGGDVCGTGVNGIFTTGPTLSSLADANSSVAGGPYAITATGAVLSNSNYTIAGYEDGELSITKAMLTVTADDKTRVYGAADPSFSFNVSGLRAGDLEHDVLSNLTVTSAANQQSGVGDYQLTMAGTLLSDNYDLTLEHGTLSITAATLLVTADDKSKIYGSSNPGLTGTVTGFVNGDVEADVFATGPTYSTSATSSSDVGTYDITATGGTLNTANYVLTYDTGTLTIGKKTLTVHVDDKSKIYGEVNPTLTGSITGFVLGQNETVLITGPTYTTTATTNSGFGEYDITASGATATNYDFNYDTGTLTIAKADLTITADDKSKVYGAANPSLTYTSNGLISGDSISSLSLSTAAATAGVGSYDIVASDAAGSGLANYNITYVDGNLSVTPAALTITADNLTKVYGDADPALTYSYSGLVNNDDATAITGALGRSAGNDVGDYGITQGSLAAANYTITFTAGRTLSITPASLTITASDRSKGYGTTLTSNGTEFTASGLKYSDTIGSVTFTSPGAVNTAGVGSYVLTASSATGGTFNAANYNISYLSGNLNVTQATLTLNPDNFTITYGDSTPTFTGSLTGAFAGDIFNVVYSAGSYAGNAGLYNITGDVTGANLANYVLVSNTGTLTVNKAVLTLTADDVSRTYGTANSFTAAFSGFKGNDTASVISGTYGFSTAASQGSNIGTYSVAPTLGSMTSGNYSFNFVPGTLTITKANLTVTPSTLTKVYGDSNPTLTGTLVGAYAPDNLSATYTTSAGLQSGVGTYDIDVSALFDPNGKLGNYNISLGTGSMTITPATLNVTADNKSRLPNEIDPPLTYSLSGLKSWDTGSVFTGSTIWTTATLSSPAGSYPIYISGGAAANYTIVYHNGTFTVAVPVTMPMELPNSIRNPQVSPEPPPITPSPRQPQPPATPESSPEVPSGTNASSGGNTNSGSEEEIEGEGDAGSGMIINCNSPESVNSPQCAPASGSNP